MMLVVVK